MFSSRKILSFLCCFFFMNCSSASFLLLYLLLFVRNLQYCYFHYFLCFEEIYCENFTNYPASPLNFGGDARYFVEFKMFKLSTQSSQTKRMVQFYSFSRPICLASAIWGNIFTLFLGASKPKMDCENLNSRKEKCGANLFGSINTKILTERKRVRQFCLFLFLLHNFRITIAPRSSMPESG